MNLRTIMLAIGLSAGLPAAAQPVLPGMGGSVCDFVAANAGRKLLALDAPKGHVGVYEPNHAFADMLTKVATFDIDGDGDLEILSINPISGTMRGDLPVAYGSSQFAGAKFLSDDDELRWNHTARWLPFKGQWYLIYFKDEALEQASAVVAVARQPSLACSFRADFTEEPISYSGDAATLDAFRALMAADVKRPWEIPADAGPLTAADQAYLLASIRRGDEPFKDAGEALSAWSMNISKTSAVRTADIDGDGTKERMAFISVSSGAGRGCDATFLEMLPQQGEAAPEPALRDLLRKMQNVDWEGFLPSPCGGYNSTVEVAGRDYVYLRHLGNSDRYRRLRYVRNGQMADAVASTFTPVHTVTFDAAKTKSQGESR